MAKAAHPNSHRTLPLEPAEEGRGTEASGKERAVRLGWGRRHRPAREFWNLACPQADPDSGTGGTFLPTQSFKYFTPRTVIRPFHFRSNYRLIVAHKCPARKTRFLNTPAASKEYLVPRMPMGGFPSIDSTRRLFPAFFADWADCTAQLRDD